METFFVYMLTNKYNKVLYTGMTNDLSRRVFEHKNKSAKGFTAKYNCVKLVWFEGHTDADEALTRERLIKRWPREWKNRLVERENGEWRDLADDW
ncbi:GIY-YIG nuclease family protein [Daejeonella sp.]|uniref:GIY-YIG nuclease family protein n=1 Tax=Daejeonella sp. TaxID=2805397 RepID=UPI00398397F2